MTLQLLNSEFPYIWGKFYILFYQCGLKYSEVAWTCLVAKIFRSLRPLGPISLETYQSTPSWPEVHGISGLPFYWPMTSWISSMVLLTSDLFLFFLTNPFIITVRRSFLTRAREPWRRIHERIISSVKYHSSVYFQVMGLLERGKYFMYFVEFFYLQLMYLYRTVQYTQNLNLWHCKRYLGKRSYKGNSKTKVIFRKFFYLFVFYSTCLKKLILFLYVCQKI